MVKIVGKIDPPEQGEDLLRRWAAIYGVRSEKDPGFFRVVEGVEVQIHHPTRVGFTTWRVPRKGITKLIVNPINGFSYLVAAIRMSWLETATFEDIRQEMEKPYVNIH